MLLLSGKMAAAQSVDLSSLEVCANLETAELKLACFEAIIASGKTSETLQPVAAESPVSEPPAAEIEAVPDAAPPAGAMPEEVPAGDASAGSTPAAVAASAAAVAVTTAPTVEDTQQDAPDVETAAENAPAPTSTATAATPPEPVDTSQLGEEHLDHPEAESKADDDNAVRARVIEVVEGHNEILYFHFENGQVWRQMEARHLVYPRSGAFDIKITRGIMGDYRMRIGDNGRLVRIRRVK